MSALLVLSFAVIAAIFGAIVGFIYWQWADRKARRLSQEFDEVYRRITGRN